MRALRRSTLLVAMAWLGLTACGQAFTGGEGGGGAGSGTTTGSHSGTSTGTSTGTASGTDSGTSAGTSAGTPAGTEAGTSAGSSAGTSAGTGTGTPSGTCPTSPCGKDWVGGEPCSEAASCMQTFCEANSPNCCDGTWSLGCATGALMACGTAICIDPYDACLLIFGSSVCPHTPDDNCGIMTEGTSGNGTTCAAVCTNKKVRCLGSITTEVCSSGDGFDSNTCNNVLPQEALVECVCARYCVAVENRPCHANESCTFAESDGSWGCVPNS